MDEEQKVLKLRDGCEFVYGGDAVDKGIGDLRFVRAMLGLKHRYPDRVHLIVGNRDCNKLRLATELSPEALRDALDDRSFPYWLQEKERITPAQALLQDGGLENTTANRLRWSSPLPESPHLKQSLDYAACVPLLPVGNPGTWSSLMVFVLLIPTPLPLADTSSSTRWGPTAPLSGAARSSRS